MVRTIQKRRIWTILLILYVGIVFHNSMTPAVESSAQSMTVLKVLLQAMDAVGMGTAGITEHLIRKAAHVTEYTVFGILLAQCLGQYGQRGIQRWQLHMLLGLVTPFVDETIQLFTKGRSGQISDVWLDFFGVLLGTGLYFCFCLLWQRKRDRRKVRRGKRQQPWKYL